MERDRELIERLKLKEEQVLFCEYLVFEGLNQTEAYMKAKPKVKYNSAKTGASSWLTKPNIVTYISKLRGEADEEREKELDDFVLTKEMALKELYQIAISHKHAKGQVSVSAWKLIAEMNKDWLAPVKTENVHEMVDMELWVGRSGVEYVPIDEAEQRLSKEIEEETDDIILPMFGGGEDD